LTTAVLKALIDTNVWLRYILEDSPTQFAQCQKLFERIEVGKILPYVSNVTIFELAYTLKTYYRLTLPEIKKTLENILRIRNLTIIEKTNSKTALKLYFKTKIKYADCLIASQIKTGLVLVTYDQDFGKLVPKQSMTPGEALN